MRASDNSLTASRTGIGVQGQINAIPHRFASTRIPRGLANDLTIISADTPITIREVFVIRVDNSLTIFIESVVLLINTTALTFDFSDTAASVLLFSQSAEATFNIALRSSNLRTFLGQLTFLSRAARGLFTGLGVFDGFQVVDFSPSSTLGARIETNR